MFAIEVVRFDAQDVIATSSTCPMAAAPTLHVYVQNGTYTVYEYDGENFMKSSITNLGTQFNNAAAESEDGWYAYQRGSAGNVKLRFSGTKLAGKCDDSLYHPIQ